MKIVKTVFLFTCLLVFSITKVWSQPTSNAVAYLNYNGEKIGTGVGFIHYSTSFFIKHIAMDEATKQKHTATVLASKNAFSKLEITTVTENKDATDKGFMVVVDVTATNNADLTSKIKFLLNELNVPSVNYNSVVYKTQDFKF